MGTQINAAPTETIEAIGARLRRIRIARGWSQKRLAELAELNRSVVCRVEKGEQPGESLMLGSAMKLAWVLGVSLDTLAGMPDLRRMPD